jgi:ubiquinone/menaquinone biosynthesis C-methylase UbiE
MKKTPVNKRDVPNEEAFDRIAERYERYVPWKSRLAREIPFLEKTFRSAGVQRLLDCACGPGRHAVALAKSGFEVVGLDASPEMLERGRQHALDETVDVDFVHGRFESFPERFRGSFEGAICLGNSFSAAEDLESVARAVKELRAALKPGGMAITQTVDFSVVARDPVTAAPLRHIRQESRDLLFVKSFVRVGEQVCIHWLSLDNQEGKWVSDVSCRPVLSVEPQFLIQSFRGAGFDPVETYGDYSGKPFEAGVSKDLIVVARS